MKYWNNNLKNMSEYIPGEQPLNMDDVIKLNTNENPFPPSKQVLESMKDACNSSLRRYPDSTAKDVRALFASMNNLDPDNVFVANGSDEIFSLLFRGFINDDGLAAFPYPSYSLYYTQAELNRVNFECVELDDDFSYNLDNFLKKKYDLTLISNPNNPTGTYCPVPDIRAFLKSYRGLLVVDEAYIDFYDGSAIELVKEYDNVIVTRSFSKSYSLAGLRVGLAISHRDNIRGFMKIKDSYNIDMVAMAGARAALLDDRGFRYNLQMVINNKEYLEERLSAMGFETVPSRANFIFTRHPDVTAETLYNRLKEKNILVRYFGTRRTSEYIRISVGTMLEIKALCSELEAITEA